MPALIECRAALEDLIGNHAKKHNRPHDGEVQGTGNSEEIDQVL